VVRGKAREAELRERPYRSGATVREWVVFSRDTSGYVPVSFTTVFYAGVTATGEAVRVREGAEFLDGDLQRASGTLVVRTERGVVCLDLLQRGDVEILFAPVAAAQTGHVVHDQDVIALLMDVTAGGADEVRVPAKAASVSHGSRSRSKGFLNLGGVGM
jgi:hypothetical protein